MKTVQDFFKSKTIWGILVALVVTVLGLFHINIAIPGADAQASQFLTSLVGIAGAIYAVYGRCVADVKGTGKPWYQSKTILGVIAAVVMTVLGYFHINIPLPLSLFGITADDSTLQVGNSAVGSIALLIAIIGRIKADGPITVSTTK